MLCRPSVICFSCSCSWVAAFSSSVGSGNIRNRAMVFAAMAILSTYFSALTAYGLHAYQFKLKRVAFLFIMAVMVIPKQVSAAGFVQLCYKLKLTNSYLPLILPALPRRSCFST